MLIYFFGHVSAGWLFGWLVVLYECRQTVSRWQRLCPIERVGYVLFPTSDAAICNMLYNITHLKVKQIPPVPFITSSYECTHKQNIAKGEKTKSQRKDCTDKQQIQRHKERIIHINKRKIGDRQNGCSKNVRLNSNFHEYSLGNNSRNFDGNNIEE